MCVCLCSRFTNKKSLLNTKNNVRGDDLVRNASPTNLFFFTVDFLVVAGDFIFSNASRSVRLVPPCDGVDFSTLSSNSIGEGESSRRLLGRLGGADDGGDEVEDMTVLNNLLSFFSSSARNSFSERVMTRSFLRVSFNALDTVSKRFDSRLKFSSILSLLLSRSCTRLFCFRSSAARRLSRSVALSRAKRSALLRV